MTTTPSAAAPSLKSVSIAKGAAGQPPTAHSKTLRSALLERVSPARLRQPVPRALAPPLGRLLHDTYHFEDCPAGSSASSSACSRGDTTARRVLIVLGDSHADMWMPALAPFAARYHWRLVPLTKKGCIPSVIGSGDCASWYRWALGQVRRLHPRAVVLSQAWSGWGPDGVAGVARALRDLAPLTHRLTVIEDPPSRDWAALDCLLARGATLGSCTFRIPPVEAAACSSVQSETRAAHASYVRTLQWFCVRGLCPTVVGTIVTYRDTSHITATYARVLARPLATELLVATRS
jgi:hypothetical protein